GVEITMARGQTEESGTSDASGFFSFSLLRGISLIQPIVLRFRHPEYQPLDLNVTDVEKLYVARMLPAPHPAHARANPAEATIANVVARYSTSATSEVNIGSAVRTFEIVNTGDEPCKGRRPCSPDGKWKAAAGALTLDAGPGNEFRNPRASCIAGPCPFAKISGINLTAGGRNIQVSALNWSDTATFLVEAEVFHPMVNNLVRRSYPVIFGEALNFTLPVRAEGVSIEAEVNGSTIIFPLGPDLRLSWAECTARVNQTQAKVYRCELKPGYRFK